MRSFQTAIFTFPTVAACQRPRQGIGGSCQNSEMATVEFIIFSCLKFRFCLKIVSSYCDEDQARHQHLSHRGIQHILSNLKPHKAAGPDTIPPTVLEELSHQISPILEIIFNKSLQTGQVPSDWKEANVAPIFKKGDKHQARNQLSPQGGSFSTNIIIPSKNFLLDPTSMNVGLIPP